ncbi:NAD/NADP octopine/nopaline dehydrogenase family protein, partial [Stenotrophomonas maltophilia]|uniref:NAD/NADP octopine/nopaline dehydrogenase family protein n=1 Tax=Stenotrophomonas maltophilia TaxID=40324 RepID=UPI0019531502
YHLTYGVPLGPLSEVGVLLQARGGDTLGPTSIESRYVTEDVPFGLWPTVLLAHQTGVRATLHEAGLNLFSALYG